MMHVDKLQCVFLDVTLEMNEFVIYCFTICCENGLRLQLVVSSAQYPTITQKYGYGAVFSEITQCVAAPRVACCDLYFYELQTTSDKYQTKIPVGLKAGT